MTWAATAALAAYVALTAGHPHRLALALLTALAAAGAGGIRLAAGRLGASPRYEHALMAWFTANGIASLAACLLDGALTSPLVGLFFLPVTFAAVALGRGHVVHVSGITIAALLSVPLLDGRDDWPAGLLWAALLAVTAAVCTTIAGDRIRRYEALRESEYEVLRRMMRLVEYRDEDTGGHIERISAYSAMLAEELGLPREACDHVRWASTMHDVGKIAVPDAILLKPGRLTPDERAVMERHAEVGHEMLQGAGSDVLALAATIALTHHERYDGTGYPRGLAGEEIPLEGRIVAVADVFDALTSERVYKRAMPIVEAVEIVRAGRGTQFDPRVVDAFLVILGDLERVRREHGDTVAARPLPTTLRVLSGA